MQKFCTKCGSKLDEVTGKCPVCDKELTKKEIKKQKKEEKKEVKRVAKKEKWKKLSFKQKVKKICLRFVLILLVLLLLFCSGTATLVYFDIVDVPAISRIFYFMGVSKEETEDATKNEPAYSGDDKQKELEALDKEIEKAIADLENKPIDADSYFQNNSDIISEVEVNKSDNVHTEMEAYNNLVERGFGEKNIETEYSMNGEFSKAKAISNTSSTKHPIYQTTYITSNGDVWTILEINGVVMANPVSYNMQSDLGTQLIITETETVVSYDSRSNKFYETIPKASELIVKKINRIDAETIETLTYGEIDKL